MPSAVCDGDRETTGVWGGGLVFPGLIASDKASNKVLVACMPSLSHTRFVPVAGSLIRLMKDVVKERWHASLCPDSRLPNVLTVCILARADILIHSVVNGSATTRCQCNFDAPSHLQNCGVSRCDRDADASQPRPCAGRIGHSCTFVLYTFAKVCLRVFVRMWCAVHTNSVSI